MITENKICLVNAIESLDELAYQLELIQLMVMNDRPRKNLLGRLKEALDAVADLRFDLDNIDTE
jgi:hypothetical protein